MFQRVGPIPTVTAKLVELIRADQLPTIMVDAEILKEATALFNPAGSKKNTLIDCSVAVIARKIKASGVFA